MLSPNVIIPFDGNDGDIPTGFTREGNLDGKYPKGTASGTDPNVAGGNATHIHTGTTSHSHAFLTCVFLTTFLLASTVRAERERGAVDYRRGGGGGRGVRIRDAGWG